MYQIFHKIFEKPPLWCTTVPDYLHFSNILKTTWKKVLGQILPVYWVLFQFLDDLLFLCLRKDIQRYVQISHHCLTVRESRENRLTISEFVQARNPRKHWNFTEPLKASRNFQGFENFQSHQVFPEPCSGNSYLIFIKTVKIS